MKINRVLSWYEKSPGSAFVEQAKLEEISLCELQQLFNQPVENPMYECYPVQQQHVVVLSQYAGRKINLTEYEYFVECYSSD